MSGWNPDLFKTALDFAARAHGAQKMTGSGFPYVVHVMTVAMETLRACQEDLLLNIDLAVTCALLHDCVEDGDVPLKEIERLFGTSVAQGVAALTKDKTLPKEEQMADSLARIQKQPREIGVVKLADRIVNLAPPPEEWSQEKRRNYRKEAEKILEKLQVSQWLQQRLLQKIQEYESYCLA